MKRKWNLQNSLEFKPSQNSKIGSQHHVDSGTGRWSSALQVTLLTSQIETNRWHGNLSTSSCQNLRKFAPALQLTAENCRSAILGQEPHHKVCSDNFNWSLIWFITQNQGWTGSLPMERIPIIPRSEKFEIGETTWMLRWHSNWVLLSRRNWITFWFWCMCLSICRPCFRSHCNLGFSLEASPVNHGVPANATPMTTCNSTSVG